MPEFATEFAISPLDHHNQALLAHVHPSDWQNPPAQELYDLVVIGAGTAGLVVAAGAAGLGIGLKVALIEKNLMGGDCLNVGCVPSKCLISASRVAATMRQSAPFGIAPPSLEIDFAAVMQRLRQIRAGISHHDSAERFSALGIDVFFGAGEFISPREIRVTGPAQEQTLRFKKAVLATGARAARPEVPGLADTGFLTNETVFNLTAAPPRLAVIGGGPIGCELAQAFQRLGSQVTLLHKNDHLLDKEDPDAAEIVQRSLLQDGVSLALGATLGRVEEEAAGKVLHYQVQGQNHQVCVDEILVGAGRVPNVEGLNLVVAGVNYGPRGIQVNDHLQTTNPKIFAAGDICMDWKFTHAADAAARIVIKNALFSPFGLGKAKLSALVMPWATYTAPEIAHVGLYQHQARAQGIATETIHIPFSSVDRALADGQTEGFVKILHRQGSDEIIGATIVAEHAGDLISEVSVAMVHKIGLSKLSSVIHPYPTQAEAIKKAADAYRRKLLTPRTQTLLRWLSQIS
jgi:pyruvate/2-oxoglutarate dehydrogenase complex dihydrolipoamide dehydrogenase (E3) component